MNRRKDNPMSDTTGLDMAIDALYESGWTALDSTNCDEHADGRLFPTLVRIQREFIREGYELLVRYVQLFDCYRAEWADSSGSPAGAVVGSSEIEAAIYALAQLRQSLKANVNP